MKTLKALIARFVREERGQDLIEYALLSAAIALVVIAGATQLGTSLNDWYSSVSTKVDGHAAVAGS